jgi:hypothetical protein
MVSGTDPSDPDAAPRKESCVAPAGIASVIVVLAITRRLSALPTATLGVAYWMPATVTVAPGAAPAAVSPSSE